MLPRPAARCLVFLAVLLALPIIAPVPITTATAEPLALRPPRSHPGDDYISDPVKRQLYETRLDNAGYSKNAWSGSVNAAVGYVDASGRAGARIRPYASHGMSYTTVSVRDLTLADPEVHARLKLGKNVTRVLIIRTLNVAKGGHSEAIMKRQVEQLGLKWSRLELLASDRQPCPRCGDLLRGTRALRNGRLPYVFRYGPDAKWNTAWLEIKRALPRLHQEYQSVYADAARERRLAQGLLRPPGSPAGGTGALPSVLRSGGPGRLGGVDFTSLELRHLATNPKSPSELRYGFQPGGRGPRVDGRASSGRRAAKQASDAFFVWLALDPSQFWVNLIIDEPDRVIDGEFGTTDAGRVLLEADLTMKKTAADVTRLSNPVGAKYWRELRQRGLNRCRLRLWIAPAPATVYADDDELYIIDAPLQVKVAAIPTKKRCKGSEYSTALYARLVGPPVERAVNSAPEYAALRRVYASRVAAEWCRQRCASGSPYAKVVGSGTVQPWRYRGSWRPRQVFKRYARSYRHGEWRETYRERRSDGVWTYDYFDGGVDFSTV